MLTAEHLRALHAPFSMKEHRFLEKKKGEKVVAELAYVPEKPITTRLDEVDPSWTFRILSKERGAKHVVIHAVLTVREVSREGIGMQRIDDEYGEAEKGATTDALRRCARMFGIARYILDAPKWRGEFAPWLVQYQRDYGMAAPAQQAPPQPPAPARQEPQQPPAQAAPAPAGAPANGNGGQPAAAASKASDDRVYDATRHLFSDRKHYLNTLAEMNKTGELTTDMDDAQEIAAIEKNRAERRDEKAGVHDWQAIYVIAGGLFPTRELYDSFVTMLVNTQQVTDKMTQTDVISTIRFLRLGEKVTA